MEVVAGVEAVDALLEPEAEVVRDLDVAARRSEAGVREQVEVVVDVHDLEVDLEVEDPAEGRCEAEKAAVGGREGEEFADPVVDVVVVVLVDLVLVEVVAEQEEDVVVVEEELEALDVLAHNLIVLAHQVHRKSDLLVERLAEVDVVVVHDAHGVPEAAAAALPEPLGDHVGRVVDGVAVVDDEADVVVPVVVLFASLVGRGEVCFVAQGDEFLAPKTMAN